MEKYTPIFLKNRLVGEVRGKTFFKKVHSSKHFLHTPKAIAFDIETLLDAQEAGADTVEVTDRDSAKVYRCFIANIFSKGFEFDRGWGTQIGLTIGHWYVVGTPIQIELFSS